MVSCVLIPFLPKIVKKNVWILFGILASSFALFLLGPSQILYFPKDSVILIAVGFALIGLFDPFILVFVLPEMIEVIEKKHPELTERQKAHLTDITTGLLTSILGIGQMLGPIYSAYFAKIFGFRLTCDVVAVVCLLLTIL
jgi:hypothetical protein